MPRYQDVCKSQYRFQRCYFPIIKRASVFSDAMHTECIGKPPEDKYTSAILFGRVATDVDQLHG